MTDPGNLQTRETQNGTTGSGPQGSALSDFLISPMLSVARKSVRTAARRRHTVEEREEIERPRKPLKLSQKSTSATIPGHQP